ncbi:MAG TPA: cytochrome P450 [Acidimicrobiia bacterium]
METLAERFDEPAFYLRDPHATYRRLRAEDPVHWYDEGQFWVITKYDDIKYISTHPLLFSSKDIAIISGLVDRRHGVPKTPMQESPAVMFMDPPEHGPYRKVVSHRFTPKEVGALDDHVRTVIRELVQGLPDGKFDLVEQVAEPVPVFVFSKLLGIPASEWHQVVEWATIITNLGSGQGTQDDMDLVMNVVGPYLWQLTMDRRADPTDDLLSLLTQAEFDGRPLNEGEIIGYATTLLAAGSETTQSLIGGLGHVLTHFPEQADEFFADPSLSLAMVEETMRWWTPVMSMAREATADVALRDKVIRKGDGVLLLYSAANRDEERWGDDAEEFVLRRPDASGQLGFGIGEHFCMGAHLARREARILLEEFAARGRRLDPVGEGELRSSTLIHTYDRLPVELVR